MYQTIRTLLFACFILIPSHLARCNEPLETSSISEIEKLGGTVRPVDSGSQNLEVAFHLRGRGLTDDGLLHVSKLSNIVSLNLRDTKITSAGLVHLKNLTSLQILHLERTAIDDSGMTNLARLRDLEYLK